MFAGECILEDLIYIFTVPEENSVRPASYFWVSISRFLILLCHYPQPFATCQIPNLYWNNWFSMKTQKKADASTFKPKKKKNSISFFPSVEDRVFDSSQSQRERLTQHVILFAAWVPTAFPLPFNNSASLMMGVLRHILINRKKQKCLGTAYKYFVMYVIHHIRF